MSDLLMYVLDSRHSFKKLVDKKNNSNEVGVLIG